MKLISLFLMMLLGGKEKPFETAYFRQRNTISMDIMYGSERYKRRENYMIFIYDDSIKLSLTSADNFTRLDTTILLNSRQQRYVNYFIVGIESDTVVNENALNIAGTWTTYKLEIDGLSYSLGRNFAPSFFTNVFSELWEVVAEK